MVKEVPGYRIKSVLKGSRGFTLSAKALNGGFLPGRKAVHWPSLKPVRLKEARPIATDVYELSVKGLAHHQVRQGDRLLPRDWDSGSCRKALFYCPRGAEYAGDSSKALTTLVRDPLGKKNIKVRFEYSGCLARAEFDEPVLGVKGAWYHFLRLEEPLMLVARGEVSRADRNFAGKALSSWKEQDDLFREFLAFELGLRGYALKPREHAGVVLPRCEEGESILIRSSRYKQVSTKIRKKASAMGGTPEKEWRDPLERHVRDMMLERGELRRAGDWFLLPGSDREEALAPMAKRQILLLREGAGYANPAKYRDRGARSNWEAMGRMGLVRYDEGLVMTADSYKTLTEEILGRIRGKGPASLADLREISPLSRRELLILLDWMEKDGLLINRGDMREAAD